MKVRMWILLLLACTLFSGIGCQSANDMGTADNTIRVKRGPKKIYVPGYYVYRKGRYKFIDGHYRWVLFPKVYEKRVMQGYATKRQDPASVR